MNALEGYYRKKGVTYMVPWTIHTDMEGVSISPSDTPIEGGMIAHSPENEEDRWYISPEFFQANYQYAGGQPADFEV